jgi:cation diffusion facilitator family transporter
MDHRKKISAERVITTSFVLDILDIILNGTVMIITGSVVMLAETFQGFVELLSDGFLLIGLKRSKRPPDKKHPFGYGRELYVWTFLSATLILFILSVFSFYIGWQRFLNPEPIEHVYLAYIVLTISVFSNTYSFSLGFRRLFKGRRTRLWEKFSQSALVETKTTFILDAVGTSAAFFGLIALALYGLTGNLRFDGIGAMMIGIIMAVFAFVLIVSVRDLLVGKSIPPEDAEKIKEVILWNSDIKEVLDLKAVIIGPERVLVNVEVHVKDGLNTNEIERLMDKIREAVKKEIPSVFHIQIELESPDHV